MSFFAGVAESSGSPSERVDSAQLTRIAADHGGGHDVGLWRDPCVALVHVQRVFTPEDRLDRLPGVFANGTSHLVFDGRLDNRDELLTALSIDRSVAAHCGDGALLMTALERWGADACERLVGAFSFAWWDAASRRLMLAVDATGGRALFFHAGAGRICFATRPVAVLAFPGVARKICRTSMAHLLLGRQVPAGVTPFSGVFRLPPAGYLVWRDGHHTVERYWRPDPARRIRYKDPRQYVEAAREILNRVVGAQLRAVGPVACQLSGGLDSSAVASTAAQLLAPTTLHTLTAIPALDVRVPRDNRRRFHNEMPLAAATAQRHSNIIPHYLPASDVTSEELDPRLLFSTVGLPMRNFMTYGAWQPLYAKARELQASVVLTGYSGNFTLSWRSEALLADLAAAGRLIELARQLRGLRRHGQSWSQIRRQLVSYLAPAWFRDALRAARGSGTTWRVRSSATRTLTDSVDAAAIKDPVRIATNEPDRDRRRRMVYLENSWATGQWSAASPYFSGCDLRDPLGDRRLVEFCLAVPSELWQSRGTPRSFAREVLSDRLPPTVVQTQARGYQNADWFYRLTALRPAFMAELARLEASPAAREMIDLPRIHAVAEDWPKDIDAAMARASDMLDIFARGIHYGRFIRWVEEGG